MKDTDNWPMLTEMSNNSASIKIRTTPPKEQPPSTSPETKRDFTPSNSETSSISDDGAVQETTQCMSEVNIQDTLPSSTDYPSVTETKENVNPHDITKDDNTSTSGKRKKPKSKLHPLSIGDVNRFCSI